MPIWGEIVTWDKAVCERYLADQLAAAWQHLPGISEGLQRCIYLSSSKYVPSM